MPVLIAAVAFLGLAVGSFLNVVIHRVPRDQSLMRPGSSCPGCGSPVRARHNVPVFGWLWLRGRCADCGERISLRYPLVELATGVLFVGLTVRLAHLHQLDAVPAFLFFGAAAVALILIDVEVRRLPNVIVFPTWLACAGLLTVAAALTGDWGALGRAGAGSAVFAGALLVIALARPGGLGLGDVKFAAVIGGVTAWLSWATLAVAALGSVLVGGAVAVALLAARRASRTASVPFGPALACAALTAIFAGSPLASAYLSMFPGASSA